MVQTGDHDCTCSLTRVLQLYKHIRPQFIKIQDKICISAKTAIRPTATTFLRFQLTFLESFIHRFIKTRRILCERPFLSWSRRCYTIGIGSFRISLKAIRSLLPQSTRGIINIFGEIK